MTIRQLELLAREEYRPTGPYFFQSGKHRGKALELLMFRDYGFLTWLLNQLNQKVQNGKNRLHQHLEWLLNQGETRIPKMLCPFCEKKVVNWFSVLGNDRDGYSISPSYTCCDSDECQSRLRAGAWGHDPLFLPFQFSVMKMFHVKFDQRQIGKLFRTVFQLPPRLTAKNAFEFFNSDEGR